MKINIGICGVGMVGTAMLNSFLLKDYIQNINLFLYDKYKENINDINSILKTDILFLCLPTLFDDLTDSYNISSIHEICQFLKNNKYCGVVILKSTVKPTTTNELVKEYRLDMVHNPEFLTARTAFNDFHNQKHIVLGKNDECSNENFNKILHFYQLNYPDADITVCTSDESESMKIFVNSFYAVKVQFFTELYVLCNNTNVDYDTIKNMMLKNGWINPMHTNVPGPDGEISYGGMCLPKDIKALRSFINDNNSFGGIVDATIKEQEQIRNNID